MIDIKVPYIPDDQIDSAQALGSKMRNKQQNGPAQFGFPTVASSPAVRDRIISALLGLSAGTQASSQVNHLGDPTVSFLAGLGGAAGAQTPEQVHMQQLSALPVEQVSENLANRFPELRGLPLGIVHQIAPILERQDTLSRQVTMALLRDKLQDENASVDSTLAKQIEDATGYPAAQLIGKRRADLQYILPTNFYNPLTGETAQASPRAKTATPPGSGEFAKQQLQLLNSVSTIKDIHKQFGGLAEAGKTGVISGNVERFKAFVSNGKFAPEARTYEKIRKGFIASLRGLSGENGVLSDFDTARLEGLFPSIGEDAGSAAKQFDEIFGIIDDRMQNLKTAFPQFADRVPPFRSEQSSGGVSEDQRQRAMAELARRKAGRK